MLSSGGESDLGEDVGRLKAEAEKYRSMKVKHAAAQKLFEAASLLHEKKEEAEALKTILEAIKLAEEVRGQAMDDFFEEAAEKLDDMKQPKLAAENYVKAAERHSFRSDHKGAIPLFLKGADAYLRASLPANAADCFRSVGEQYDSLSEPILAAQNIEKEAEQRLQLSDTHEAIRDLNDAKEFYSKVGQYDQSARILKRIADLLAQKDDMRRSEQYYLLSAEDLQRAADESKKLDNSDRAISFLLEAASIYQKGSDLRRAADCHLHSAELYVKIDNTNEASQNYRKAVIEYLLEEDLTTAKALVDHVKEEKVRATPAFKQAQGLVDIFENGDEARMNNALKEISDFSCVRLSLAFGRFMK
jgi:tetratricopeptide (TPR) repeat protein